MVTEHTNRGVEEGEISNVGHVIEQSLLRAAGLSSAGELLSDCRTGLKVLPLTSKEVGLFIY